MRPTEYKIPSLRVTLGSRRACRIALRELLANQDTVRRFPDGDQHDEH
jgi:hypothetical protein